ncbi:hypothetical protein MSM1_11805 [Mycobacterium sp. SM1]|uniref:hypothetical protein n=1 Tax=Mycobacterium sp. SM1 TaxID=2816243 RepID=UPI001BD1A271|nr:hypothetical protein [Mycobacterium sp. SM1]MBS4728986.1 hypothetical protein [Mycobacterium sp. SM1]
MLTLQNRLGISALATIGSRKAGSLTTRAWGTLRAVAQGAAPTRAVASLCNTTLVFDALRMPNGTCRGATVPAREPAPRGDKELLRIMPRGAERC